MPNSEILMAGAVIVALVSALLLMAAFGMADRIIFFLQLVFVLSTGSALWCAVSKNSFTEYAIWTMYLTGFALMVLMFLRFLPQRPTRAKRPNLDKPDRER